MQTSHAPEVLSEFAPTGVMRVALNYGNPILVARTQQGAPVGISVSIANALAQHLGLELRFIEYDQAADVSSDAEKGNWDVCFLAADPKRARSIAFTKPYLQIEGTFLAGPAASANDAEDLLASGVPIGVVEGSAYTLTLQRMPGADQLVIFKTFKDLLAGFDGGRVVAIAGIDQVMRAEADRRPGARVLHPPFMEICQAIGVPLGRQHAYKELEHWLDVSVQNGAISKIFEMHGFHQSA